MRCSIFSCVSSKASPPATFPRPLYSPIFLPSPALPGPPTLAHYLLRRSARVRPSCARVRTTGGSGGVRAMSPPSRAGALGVLATGFAQPPGGGGKEIAFDHVGRRKNRVPPGGLGTGDAPYRHFSHAM